MLDSALERVTATILDRPRTVVVLALLVATVAGWFGTNLEFRTSRRELVPDGDVNQERWDEVRAGFHDPEPLILAIERTSEATPAAAAERAAERIANRLTAHPDVGNVFYRVDLDWISRHALFLAPPDQLRDAVRELNDALGGPEATLSISNFADLNNRLAERIEVALDAGTTLPTGTDGTEAARLHDFISTQQDFLAAPLEWTSTLASNPFGLLSADSRAAITGNGFLATEDGLVLFVLVHPAGQGNGGLELAQRLVALTREATAAVGAEIEGLTFGLTGPPAMEAEEMAAVGRDGTRTSLIAIAGVFVLSLFAFHRRTHALFGLAALAVGVVAAIGAVWLQFGYLNLITTSLIPILVGMGIDYAVHPISQYEIERRTHSRRDAVRQTLRKTSRPVVVSALTTSAAFFCFVLMEFKGFSELGLVTGVGVILCLGAALLVLPALLVLAGRGHREQRGAMVDRLWDEGAARAICGKPALVVVLAVVATLVALPALWSLRVSTSLLDMLPVEAESVRYLELMSERSALRNDFNLVVVDSLEELREIEGRAASHPEIERVDSVLTFLPSDPDQSATAVAAAADFLDRLAIGSATSTPERLLASLGRLERALADSADSAFMAGLGALAGELEEARLEVETMQQAVEAAGPVEREAWRTGEELLQTRARSFLDQLREAATAAPPTVRDLPTQLASRFTTQSGAFVGYLYPTESIYDEEFLARFNEASRATQPGAIGFPMIFEDHSRLITAGFGAALGVGALLVVILLMLDFRRFVDPLLALVPVLLGLVWLLGMTYWFDINLNFANLIAIPIVLGVGIDAGVHMVHRFRLERNEGMVVALAHTGRAILVASLTTMVGFGSLAFASHRGMASLGTLLFLGVGACLVAAVVVLPNMLLLLGLARR